MSPRSKSAKTKKMGRARTPSRPLYAFLEDPVVLRAIARLQRAFPISGPLRNRPVHFKNELLAERLVVLALAHIEMIAPRFRQMIGYCKAEELDQTDYLHSLIRVKFQKNLHRNWDDDDDDDDGDSPTETPLTPVGSNAA